MISQTAYQAYGQMFCHKQAELPEGIKFIQSITATSKLKRITTTIPHQKETILLTFLEQNPYKNSVYGKRAKDGSTIMWVIARYRGKEKWMGRIEDARWYPK